MALGGRLQLTWAHQLRYRESRSLDYERLCWYRDATRTYRLTAGYIVPSVLKPFAQITIEGLEHIPRTGPVILAANHRDNLDAYVLMHLVPRLVHFVARPDAFGTGPLCTFWRWLGAFPADAWGMRYASDPVERWRRRRGFPAGEDHLGAVRCERRGRTARLALGSADRPGRHLWHGNGPCDLCAYEASLRLRPFRTADNVHPERTLSASQPDGRGRHSEAGGGAPGRTEVFAR